MRAEQLVASRVVARVLEALEEDAAREREAVREAEYAARDKAQEERQCRYERNVERIANALEQLCDRLLSIQSNGISLHK